MRRFSLFIPLLVSFPVRVTESFSVEVAPVFASAERPS